MTKGEEDPYETHSRYQNSHTCLTIHPSCLATTCNVKKKNTKAPQLSQGYDKAFSNPLAKRNQL